jgi:lipopolysaccharide transport system permease protein
VVGFGTWQVLGRGWYFATRCVEISRRYLRRMYLPRLTLLVASPFPALLLYLVYCALAGLAVGYYTIFEHDFPLRLGLNTLLLPAGLLMVVGLVLCLGLWTSVLGAQARDVRWTVRSITGVWYLFSPVIYPLSALPGGFKTAAQFNPMTAPMEMVRQALFSTGEVTLTAVAVTVGAIAVVSFFGLIFFSKSEAAALDYL